MTPAILARIPAGGERALQTRIALLALPGVVVLAIYGWLKTVVDAVRRGVRMPLSELQLEERLRHAVT